MKMKCIFLFSLLVICSCSSPKKPPTQTCEKQQEENCMFLSQVTLTFEADNESCSDILERLVIESYENDIRFGLLIRDQAGKKMDAKTLTIPEKTYSVEAILNKISEASGVSYFVENQKIIFSK